MNYYERHLGDYARDTGHLTALEHGVYTLLLDRYYATEQGIPDEIATKVCRCRDKKDRAAVASVLREFFTIKDGVWISGKAEEIIATARVRIDTARNNGKLGGRPSKQPEPNPEETQQEPDGLSLGSETETQTKAHHAPCTTYQAKAKKTAGPALPAWLPADVWADWHRYRNSQKGWTQHARALSLRSLTELHGQGEDLRRVVEQSIERGWTGLFTTKGRGGQAASSAADQPGGGRPRANP